MKLEIIKQTELRRVGHDYLSTLLNESFDGCLRDSPEYGITIEQAVGIGILATLLRIADDQSGIRNALEAIAKDSSKLLAIQNTAILVGEL